MTLQALVDATPSPPDDVDADALLIAFEAMHAGRQQILDRLTAPIIVTDEDQQLSQMLAERQTAWSCALAQALVIVSQHRLNTGKLRGYAPAL